MNIITLDFETYFSDDFTLDRMTTESYVRDPRFEAHGCAFSINGSRASWYTLAELPNVFAAHPLKDFGVICHHAHFDGLILNHHFQQRPAYWLDTLSMARQQHGNHISASLDNVRKYYGLPFKRTPYHLFKNKHWHEMDAYTQQEVAAGCCDEVESIWQIFNMMHANGFPPECYPWVDNTIRMFTEPRLVGDIDMLAQLWQEEDTHKRTLLANLGVTAKDLGSDEVFAGLLRQLGVEPGEKTTAKGNIKYAFAKTDHQMQEWAEDEDDDVRALVEARISIKSSLQQTRSERLGWMATRGAMPMYIAAFAAHTNRDGGGDKINPQNFKRNSKLGKALKAPPGYRKVKVDKAQIECRILNMFAGQWDVIEKFRNKEDPYVGIASQFYGYQVRKPKQGDPDFEAMEAARGTGKQLELSCGYGAGGPTIVHTARKGTYGPPVYLTDEEGLRARDLYRSTHPAVTALWREAGRLIAAIGGTNKPVLWECVEVHTGMIIGPGGTRLRYPDLSYDYDGDADSGDVEGNWKYTSRYGRTKLYGAKLVENLIQWLAWIAFEQDIVRIGKESGMWPVLREHDAGTWLVPDNQYLDQTVAWIQQEMSRPPAWMPDIPLDADATVSDPA